MTTNPTPTPAGRERADPGPLAGTPAATTPDLDAIRARLDASTPGPWLMRFRRDPRIFADVSAPSLGDDQDDTICEVLDEPDTRLIAHAPADLAALLAEVDRLTAERDEWRNASRSISDNCNEIFAASNRRTAERDAARAALAALVAWVADKVGYPVQMTMPDAPIPAAAWDALVDHVHADASGDWHGNTLDREEVESWLAEEAGIDLAALLAKHAEEGA